MSGWTNEATSTSFAIPEFTGMSLLYGLGVSNFTAMLNQINALPIALMLPCSVAADANGTLQGVSFATQTNAAGCVGQVAVFWSEVHADGSYVPQPRQTLNATAERVGTCGAAVRRSNGLLPGDTCAQIAAQYAQLTGVPSDISDSTMLYYFSPLAAGVSTYVGLLDLVAVLELSSTVQTPFRDFGVVYFASYGLTGIMGPNTPDDWRRLYNVPSTPSQGGAGLLAAPALYAGFAYYGLSPADLVTANTAFGAPVPQVANVTFPVLFPPNNPASVYGSLNYGEAALDIQTLTQYGAGSGGEFGLWLSMPQSLHRGP
jgi:hypothetical protein